MGKIPSINEQMDLIRQGVEEIISEEELIKKLEYAKAEDEPVIVKLGCDPSVPDLHIGHAIVLRKLRHFQDLGHQAVLVIGDFTGMIGDPSGKSKTRPQLTYQEVRDNADTYVEQASVILDVDKLKIVFNSEWLGEMTFKDVITLAGHYTVARMLERDDFENRYKNEVPISIHEFLYPLAQGMDSVKLKADVELGGTDQKFNLIVGRNLQRAYSQDPQVIITTPLLEGTDGVEKMSKSYRNYIGITESPGEMYGRTMSIPDTLIERYFEFATEVPPSELSMIKQQLMDKSVNPRDLKRQLAREIVTIYHSEKAALEAEKEFDRIFISKDIPESIEEYRIGPEPVALLQVIVDSGLVSSKREGRRLVEQGAVRLDGEKITDFHYTISVKNKVILKVGKRRFLRLVP
ncbi:MAG: tyrosine--tRNA ligase [Candidatus Marinimicrobia bacterium]|nr:tyrosine--tRNA ligase [Candidatus Neomarinimicrobiota bacterium]